ncbi:synapsin II [Pelomyxa schiedti]|nr:synapsin II [Pelomyxa schiedti]
MPKTLLIIDFSTNWYAVFNNKAKPRNRLANGDQIIIEQTEWKYMSIKACSDGRCWVHINRSEDPFPCSSQSNDRVISPDFLLIRNFPTTVHDEDFKNILMGFMFANIPSVNNLQSVYLDMQRPLIYNELRKCEVALKERARAAGRDTTNMLSVVPMQYFGNQGGVLGPQEIQNVPINFPTVMKVGNCHAGYGKALVAKATDLADISSIVALNRNFYTVEEYLDFEWEYRIQCVGENVRCFKRESKNHWKSNWGNLVFEDYPVAEHHVEFARECAKIWGGLDIFAIDVVHMADGREFVLEINNSSNGFYFKHEVEDAGIVADLVLAKMNALWH